MNASIAPSPNFHSSTTGEISNQFVENPERELKLEQLIVTKLLVFLLYIL